MMGFLTCREFRIDIKWGENLRVKLSMIRCLPCQARMEEMLIIV